MPFYHYRQNNSGGSFISPAVNVYVEADDVEEANKIFVTIDGCYFDPDYKRDCECCGTRWNEPYDENGHSNIYEVYREIDKDNTVSQTWGSLKELTNSGGVAEYLIREKNGQFKLF